MCPRCKSNEVSPSKRRKFTDFMMWFLAMRAYRCRDCNKRFYVPFRIDRKLRADRKWVRDVQEDRNKPKRSKRSRQRKR